MRLIAGAFALALLALPVGAQTIRLDDVVARLNNYLQGYEERLANVVAEEAYSQWVDQGPGTQRSRTSRMLRSDFALTLTSERNRWVGYRDTFEVDGVPVRDRDERLERLLSSGAVDKRPASPSRTPGSISAKISSPAPSISRRLPWK